MNSFAILTKSLLPLPDKYHGLTDVDKRYRQRLVPSFLLLIVGKECVMLSGDVGIIFLEESNVVG